MHFWKVSLLALGLLSGPVRAWKPVTHASLAQVAVEDMLDDGKVSLFRVNGQKLGDFPVDPDLLRVIQANPAYYQAGVLGPDAYPDIATGQCVIHPDESRGGSNAWLEHIWGQAHNLPDGPHRDRCLAWTCGFLAHAAGDMYAHDYINQFAGGDFELGLNGLKHIVLEGHVAACTPNNFSYAASIDGIEDFLYATLVDRVGSAKLREELLVGPQIEKSLPAQFSILREQLEGDIRQYYALKKEFQDASLLDKRKTAYARRLADNPLWPAWVTYQEHWRDDVVRGLQAWPKTSHEVALALFFNPNGTDVTRAQQVLDRYAQDHLLSMAGLPDAVGASARLVDAVVSAVLPEEVRRRIRRWKENLLLELLKSATGIDGEELKKVFTRPDDYFDATLGPASAGPGRKIDLATFDRVEMGRTDGGPMDYRKFRPAYNTVVAIKLSFLAPGTVDEVIRALDPHSSLRAHKANVLLGYHRKLDGSRQWEANPDKMIFAEDRAVYSQLFY